MDDEANRCWCGSTLKGKPHNCIGTQGRIEGLLSENLNLREAIRGEREKNGVLSIWLKEEGDKVKALELQIAAEKTQYGCLKIQEQAALKERDNALLQVDVLKAVAEAAKNALGCCDYGCDQFTGCDHKGCCSLDVKVIEALRVALYAEKRVEPSQKCKCVWYPSMVTPYKDPDCQNPMHS